MASDIYSFVCSGLDGAEIRLAEYVGKVLLIVNTASQCGFTPQYAGLEKLWQEFGGQGLVVLGFPCNQFGNQEPGTTAEIRAFCERKYGVSFTLSEKVDVNGSTAHPLFQYLTEQAPGVLGSRAIKWNFTKFLVDSSGTVVSRYAPTSKPEDLAPDIARLLAKR